MTITLEMILIIFSLITSVVGFLAMAYRYGADQQKLRSKNELQDTKFDALEKRCDSDRQDNKTQHLEFYAVRDSVTGLNSNMEHIMESLKKIEGFIDRDIERRRTV